MKYHNIEKSSRPGEYVGYGRETTFRIQRTNTGINPKTGKRRANKGWTATGVNEVFCAMSLEVISKWLEAPVAHKVEGF
jgi:hypothetical protein